jgi:hypothetical protein
MDIVGDGVTDVETVGERDTDDEPLTLAVLQLDALGAATLAEGLPLVEREGRRDAVGAGDDESDTRALSVVVGGAVIEKEAEKVVFWLGGSVTDHSGVDEGVVVRDERNVVDPVGRVESDTDARGVEVRALLREEDDDADAALLADTLGVIVVEVDGDSVPEGDEDVLGDPGAELDAEGEREASSPDAEPVLVGRGLVDDVTLREPLGVRAADFVASNTERDAVTVMLSAGDDDTE